jgi:hypothetical protein
VSSFIAVILVFAVSLYLSLTWPISLPCVFILAHG